MNPVPRLARQILLFLIAGAGSLAPTADAFRQPESKRESSIPPWKRPLSGEAASQVEKLEQQLAQLRRAGRFAEAIEPARAVAEIRTRLQGADLWQAADARRAVDDLRTRAALPEEGRKALALVEELDQKAEAQRQRAHTRTCWASGRGCHSRCPRPRRWMRPSGGCES